MSNLATTLKRASRAEARRTSIKSLADRSDVWYSALHAFINDDKRSIDLDTASRLAKVLGLELRPLKRRA